MCTLPCSSFSALRSHPETASGLERRPASVLLTAAGALLAGVFKSRCATSFQTVQPDGVGPLDLDDALAAPTADAQHVLGDLVSRARRILASCSKRSN